MKADKIHILIDGWRKGNKHNSPLITIVILFTKIITRIFFLFSIVTSTFVTMNSNNNHNQFTLMDSNQLQELVRDIAEVKETLLKMSGKTNFPSLLRTSEVKKLLKLSDSSLAGLRQNGSIPFTKVGGTIYFLKKDILELVVQNYSGVYEK